MTAVVPDKAFYRPVDTADSEPARPDFAGLIYPVLSMMPPYDNTHSRRSILGLHPLLGGIQRQVMRAGLLRRGEDRRDPHVVVHL